ncbi:MalY/PatB family protein [Nocardioides sp. Root151]|uniref:MalY/PatB family protein n=1 Tax=Nocardioides sp. Root151 TaxID=1736475 RepID=UPI000702A152|nr:MalY/PatB family protein [Nocardioides sp. Root151]KQZ67489.1 cystathionine beta-lyase [Nocardioides sp. Root151]
MAPVPNPLEALSREQLQQRTSLKWNSHPADVLPLWVAEMDVSLAEPVAQALHRAVELGDTGYPFGDGLARALAEFAAKRWGWSDFPVDRTAIVPDVMLGIVEVLRLVTEPGDPVIVNAPVYAPFYAFLTHADRQVVESPLTEAGRVDLDALVEVFRQVRTTSPRAAYLISNPHNPTGAVHTRAELEAIAVLARQHGVRVIVDEIHAPLILAGAEFTPYLTVAGSDDAFSLMSASKGWNLAGLKAALVIAGSEAVDDLARMPEEVSHGPSHLGIIAHAAAFRHGGDWLDALLVGLDENRTLLGDLLTEHLPQVGFLRPEGTYLAWVDCRPLGLDAPDSEDNVEGDLAVVSDLAGPARHFLDHARVALSSGHVFGAGGRGHVRINFATSRAILTGAVTRMARSIG